MSGTSLAAENIVQHIRQICDFDDYQRNKKVDFLMNDAIQTALTRQSRILTRGWHLGVGSLYFPLLHLWVTFGQ